MYGFTNYNEKKTIYQCFIIIIIIILRKTKNEGKRGGVS